MPKRRPDLALRKALERIRADADSYIAHVRRIAFKGTSDEVNEKPRRRLNARPITPQGRSNG